MLLATVTWHESILDFYIRTCSHLGTYLYIFSDLKIVNNCFSGSVSMTFVLKQLSTLTV